MKKLLLLFALACSTTAFSQNKVKVTDVLVSYVREWGITMQNAGIPWETEFRKIKSITVEDYSVVNSGKAALHYEYSNMITINSAIMKHDPCMIRATIFHELGHAVFGLDHGSCIIMRSSTMTREREYCDHWDSYLKEYLVQCKKARYAR